MENNPAQHYNDDGFIELDRTFHELRGTGKADDDSDTIARFFGTGPLNWEKLLLEHRVVMLSEAGSGKTEEIRNTARKLRSAGKLT